MGKLMLRICIIIAVFVIPLPSLAKQLSSFDSGDWRGGVYSDEATGAFSHCLVNGDGKSDSSLIVSIDRSYIWSIGLFDFALPSSMNVQSINYRFDGGKWSSVASATDGKAIHVNMPGTVIGLFRRSHLIEVFFQGRSYKFELKGTSRLLADLTKCVQKQLAFENESPKPTMNQSVAEVPFETPSTKNTYNNSPPLGNVIVPKAAIVQSIAETSPPDTIQSFDSRVTFPVAKLPEQYDYHTQQLLTDRAHDVANMKWQEQQFQAEHDSLDAQYAQQKQNLAQAHASGNLYGIAAANQSISTLMKLYGDLSQRSMEFNKTSQATVNGYNDKLMASEADRAVRDLMHGDPSRASLIVSQAGGTQRVFQPAAGGGFVAIGPDGKYELDPANGQARKFSAQDIAEELYSIVLEPKLGVDGVGLR